MIQLQKKLSKFDNLTPVRISFDARTFHTHNMDIYSGKQPVEPLLINLIEI